MTVWVLAEDQVELIRTDLIKMVGIAFNDVASTDHNPADVVRRESRVRIVADLTDRDRTTLLTIPGPEGLRAVQELVEIIAKAGRQAESDGPAVLYVHGPLPRFTDHRKPLWYIATELPTQGWPQSGAPWWSQPRRNV